MDMEKVYLVELSTGSYEDKNTRILKVFRYPIDAINYVERCNDIIVKIRAHNESMSDVLSYNDWESCFYQCTYNEINGVTVFEMPLI